jgi:hypothetical protein
MPGRRGTVNSHANRSRRFARVRLRVRGPTLPGRRRA